MQSILAITSASVTIVLGNSSGGDYEWIETSASPVTSLSTAVDAEWK